jgi:hypothetical protein
MRSRSRPPPQSKPPVASEVVVARSEEPPGPRRFVSERQRRWGVAILACCAYVLAFVALARGASPMAAMATRPRLAPGATEIVDWFLQRPGPTSPGREGTPVRDRGDWVLAANESTRRDIVRCLTARAECDFESQPVAERVYACAFERPEICSNEQIRGPVCLLHPQSVAAGGEIRTCGTSLPAPTWLLFTNRDVQASAVNLERDCRDQLARWCEWRPRETFGRKER